MSAPLLHGIDVSKWNDRINWEAVAKHNVKFAFIRCGVGAAKGGFTLDPKFAVNVNGAHSVGIPVGVYMYSYARSVSAAQAEAQGMLGAISGYKDKITWPVVYDIEEDEQAKLGQAICTAMCNAFCDMVEKAGYTPMVYCNANWYKNYLLPNMMRHDLWLAYWRSKDTDAIPHTVWQYTDAGNVGGISGNVDLNIAYKDYGAAPQTAEELEQTLTEPAPEPMPKDEADGWAKAEWEEAYRAGILDGTRPKDPISRQEMAVILKRLELI